MDKTKPVIPENVFLKQVLGQLKKGDQTSVVRAIGAIQNRLKKA